jgi:hypothetical protein
MGTADTARRRSGVRTGSGRSVTLSAEAVDVPEGVRQPARRAAPGSDMVVRIVELEEVNRAVDIRTRIVDVGGSFPPDPLAGAEVVLPHIVQEAGRLRFVGAIPKAAKQKQIAIVGADPSRGAPARSWNAGRRFV